jgi:hypothetical protein
MTPKKTTIAQTQMYPTVALDRLMSKVIFWNTPLPSIGVASRFSTQIKKPKGLVQHQSEEPETSDWTVAPEGVLTMTVAGCSKLTFVGAQLCVGSPSSLNMKVTVTLCGSVFPEGEQNRQFFKAFTADSPKIR